MVYAEDINYWKSSQTSPDSWIDKAKKEIQGIKGKIQGEAFGQDANGRAAFMLAFAIGEDSYRITWSVLPVRSPNATSERAAKIQAATLLYHDVKHKCVMAKVKGTRSSFLEYYLLPTGQTVAQAANDKDQFLQLPAMLNPNN